MVQNKRGEGLEKEHEKNLHELRIRRATDEYFITVEIIVGINLFPIFRIRRGTTWHSYAREIDQILNSTTMKRTTYLSGL